MSTPNIETIALKIEALINAITTSAGFNQTLVVVRPKRLHLEGDINDDNTVILEQEDGYILEQTSDAMIFRQGFAIQALVIDSDDATDAIDTRLNKVAFDILKKIYTGSNWSLDGYVEAIYLRDPSRGPAIEKFIPAGAMCSGVSVNIEVQYQLSISQLTT